MEPFLFVLRDLSRCLGLAAFQVTGELKSSLLELIDDLETNPKYDISRRNEIIDELRHALEHFYKNEDWEGGADLSRLNTMLWQMVLPFDQDTQEDGNC